MSHTVKLGDRGRLVIPADVRARLGLEPGDKLSLSERDGALQLMPVAARIESLRGAWTGTAAGRALGDELLADRRAEATDE